MDNADFYLGKGKYGRYLGSVGDLGDIAYLDGEYDLFGFNLTESRDFLSQIPLTRFTETDWLAKVDKILTDEGGSREWPWDYPDSSGTRYTYAWDNGNITTWVYGRQIMLSYPNLARNVAVFPSLSRGDAAMVTHP